jgi:predicted protein tyrosine phosphatase
MNICTTLPTIVNIDEAAYLANEFPAVITAGPEAAEVNHFGHSNHLIVSFDDIMHGDGAPTLADVKAMLKFASENDGEILIHCHAGMSRSTATAWGVAIQRGYDPYDAYDMLKNVHPRGRMFWPNDAIVEALEVIFDISGLSDYNNANHYKGSI